MQGTRSDPIECCIQHESHNAAASIPTTYVLATSPWSCTPIKRGRGERCGQRARLEGRSAFEAPVADPGQLYRSLKERFKVRRLKFRIRPQPLSHSLRDLQHFPSLSLCHHASSCAQKHRSRCCAGRSQGVFSSRLHGPKTTRFTHTVISGCPSRNRYYYSLVRNRQSWYVLSRDYCVHCTIANGSPVVLFGFFGPLAVTMLCHDTHVTRSCVRGFFHSRIADSWLCCGREC
jgi:hypothetical protein